MPASNIQSVVLNGGGSVTIEGQFTDIADYTVTLLHVWFAGTGQGQVGAGLAVDCLATGGPGKFNGKTFTLTDFGANNPGGANSAKFTAGPATVSAIAVLTPKEGNANTPAQVIQWSRTLTLSADNSKHVKLSTFAP